VCFLVMGRLCSCSNHLRKRGFSGCHLTEDFVPALTVYKNVASRLPVKGWRLFSFPGWSARAKCLLLLVGSLSLSLRVVCFLVMEEGFVPVLTIYENVGFWTLPSASARLWPRNQDSFPFEVEYWMGIVVD
jgi:hypothetical protein